MTIDSNGSTRLGILIIVVFLLCLQSGIALSEPTLDDARLQIKFVPGTHIVRHDITSSIRGVGIESLDSLSVQLDVYNYEKLARDFPESSPLAMYYMVHFNDPKSDMESVKLAFESDPHIEFASLVYNDTAVSWRPTDYFYNLPVMQHGQWPPSEDDAHPNDCGNGYFTNWGRANVEQWYLKNDGEIEISPDYTWGGAVVAGADINAEAGWDYYFDNTPEDPNIDTPGDPRVVLANLDTGIEPGIPEIEASLWYNSLEDHGTLNKFDPDHWWDDPIYHGDKGSPTGGWRVGQPQPPGWDGYPGGQGDNDGDGYSDWSDPGIIEIMWDNQDNDYDGHANDGPGGAHCDCPIELVTTPGLLKPDGTPYTMQDIGIPGVDDDGDGFIDECDGAMFDDDESGYVDDVIGWNFSNNSNNPYTLPGGNPHGTTMFGASVAKANNVDFAVPPDNFCPPYPALNENISRVRVGISGVCPDCRMMELKWADPFRGITFALSHKVNIGVTAIGNNPDPRITYDLFNAGAIYIQAGDNYGCEWQNNQIHSDVDDPCYIRVTATGPDDYCARASKGRWNDIASPGSGVISTNFAIYNVNDPNDPNRWYKSTIAKVGPGCSIASQLVAGVAGMLQSFSLQNSRGWNNSEIMSRLINGAKRYNQDYHPEYARDGGSIPTGVGRLDLLGSLSISNPYDPTRLEMKKAFVDQGVGPGNQDGVISQGESVGLYYELFNWGGGLNATMTFSCNDPYVNVTNGIASISIPPFAIFSTKQAPISIQVSDNAPPGHVISYTIDIDAGGVNYLHFPINQTSEPPGPIVSLKELYSLNNVTWTRYPVIGDLDRDGLQEIVNANENCIEAFNSEDGSLLWRNTSYSSFSSSAGMSNSPSIGDVNSDGYYEVVFIGRNSSQAVIVVLDGRTGTVLAGPININTMGSQPPVLTDWNSDGKLDIAALDDDGVKIYRIDNSNFISLVQINILNCKAVSAADLNNDGLQELVLTEADGVIRLINNSGMSFYSTPHPPNCAGGNCGGPTAIGDIDNDAQLEIVFLTDDSAWMLDYANSVWGPPTSIYTPGLFTGMRPSLGDWDNNDILEIFFYDRSDVTPGIRISHYNGATQYIPEPTTEGGVLEDKGDILVADVNSDSRSDIIFRGNQVGNTIWGSSYLGTGIWGEANLTICQTDAFIYYSSPFIDDLSGDGILDIGVATGVRTNGKLEAFNTGGVNHTGAMQWPQYRHDARRTSLYAQPVQTLHVTQNMTIWDNMVVWQGIYVDPGVTLTIKPGVTLEFKPIATFIVNGRLSAIGTKSQPIEFTGTSLVSGSWLGIEFGAQARIDMNHCNIQYGTYGLKGSVATDASVNIDSCTFRNISNTGILGYYCNIHIYDTEVSSCGIMGLDIFKTRLDARRCSIVNTGSYGIKLNQSPGTYIDSTFVIDNTLTGTSATGSIGIYSYKSDKLSLRNNKVYNYEQAGIKVSM